MAESTGGHESEEGSAGDRRPPALPHGVSFPTQTCPWGHGSQAQGVRLSSEAILPVCPTCGCQERVLGGQRGLAHEARGGPGHTHGCPPSPSAVMPRPRAPRLAVPLSTAATVPRT